MRKAKINVDRDDLTDICEFLEQYTGTYSAQRNIEFIARAVRSSSINIADGRCADATHNHDNE